MKLACIGGGPAGLYLAILVRRANPAATVTVYERNAPDDTFGFGVVFSDATLGRFAAADPASHAAITSAFTRWDDIELHVRGATLRSTGHGFCGLERQTLLRILTARAREVGVDVRHGVAIDRLADAAPADLYAICDGVGSTLRDQQRDAFGPAVDLRPNKFAWLGTSRPLTAFTFYFVETPHGLLRVHAYPFAADRSTFIVECTADTWRRAGLEGADEDRTIAVLTPLLARELAGYPLLKNRSIWRSFPTVRCAAWRAATAVGPAVLLGDAVHTAHFSIGSGTKLAMEDAIALADALAAPGDVPMPTRLARYEAARRPAVESLQAAAEASLGWFEHTERYRRLSPAQFTYSLMTRSLRVTHASMRKRDPELCATIEAELGCDGTTPALAGFAHGTLRLASRLCVEVGTDGTPPPHTEGGVPGDRHLIRFGGLAERGAALIISEPLDASADLARAGNFNDDQMVGWHRVVDAVHALGPARIAAQLRVDPAAPTAFVEAVWRADHAGFDALVLAVEAATVERVSAALRSARRHWPEARPLIVRIQGADDATALACAHAAGQGGAAAIWIGAGADRDALLRADELRHEAQLPTLVSLDLGALDPDDVDAAICAGRADAIVLPAAPSECGWTRQAVRA